MPVQDFTKMAKISAIYGFPFFYLSVCYYIWRPTFGRVFLGEGRENDFFVVFILFMAVLIHAVWSYVDFTRYRLQSTPAKIFRWCAISLTILIYYVSFSSIGNPNAFKPFSLWVWMMGVSFSLCLLFAIFGEHKR